MIYMADSDEYHVWRDMAVRMKDTLPYTSTAPVEFLKTHTGLTCGSLLDAGCSLGLFDQLWIDAGFDVTGIDQIVEAIAIAKTKVPRARYHVFNLTKHFFDMGERFDVVFTNTVLQHIRNEWKEMALTNILRHLKPAGIYFISEKTFDEKSWTLEHPFGPSYSENATDNYSFTESGWITLLKQYHMSFLVRAPAMDWYLFKKEN